MRTLPHQGWKPAAQHWKLVPGRHQQALSLRGGYCDIPSGLKEAVNPSLSSATAWLKEAAPCWGAECTAALPPSSQVALVCPHVQQGSGVKVIES